MSLFAPLNPAPTPFDCRGPSAIIHSSTVWANAPHVNVARVPCQWMNLLMSRLLDPWSIDLPDDIRVALDCLVLWMSR
jgi:hypothetical protein